MCEKHAIHVVLDMHTDMVGSANCGWGLPMWLSKAAAPELIGKPLTTGLPYSLISSLDLKETVRVTGMHASHCMCTPSARVTVSQRV